MDKLDFLGLFIWVLLGAGILFSWLIDYPDIGLFIVCAIILFLARHEYAEIFRSWKMDRELKRLVNK